MDGHKFNGQRKGTHVEGEWEKRGERECRTRNQEGLNNTKESGPYKNVSPM